MVVHADSASPPSRGARRRARTHSALLEAAEEIFRRDGRDAARIEDIAELADVSVGSIYTHFESKYGLYLAVTERSLDLFAEYMARAANPEFSALERVLAAGDAYLRFHLEHPGAFQFLAYPQQRPGVANRDAEARIRERVGGLLADNTARIEDAVAAGESRPVDAARLTRYLWGAWNGVISLSLQPEGLRLSADEIARTLDLGRWLLREALGAPALRDEYGAVGDRISLPRI